MSKEIIPIKRLVQSIRWSRSQKVLFDFDLAALYGVQTKNLNKAVKRNVKRFPADFMFQFTSGELCSLRFQIGTSKGRGGLRYRPYAFTEQGIAMLSSVLNSERAIKVNIAIMRALWRVDQHDEDIAAILEAIRQLMAPPEKSRPEIGFHVRERAPHYRVCRRT